MEGRKRDSAEAVIVGGGIFGAAVAHRLSARLPGGVALLERNRIAGGSTAKAATLLSLARNKACLIPWVRRTYDLIAELSAGDGASLGFARVGALHLAGEEGGVMAIDATADVSRANGVTPEEIDPGEAGRLLPWLDAGILKKVWKYDEEAFVDAYQLTRRLLEQARATGCQVREGVAAKRILTDDRGVRGVETDGGIIATRRVVLAAGVYANTLLAEHGLALPMTPVRSQYWISGADPELFPRRQPICILPDARAYTRPENGSLIFGWREREGAWSDPRDIPHDAFGYAFAADPDGWDNLAGCVESLSPYFRRLEDTGIAHYVAGFSGYAPDGLFCLGGFPQVPGLVAAAGCSGMGIAVCGGVGLAAAQLALGEEPFADITPFSPRRLGAIDPFSAEFMRRCAEARSGKVSG